MKQGFLSSFVSEKKASSYVFTPIDYTITQDSGQLTNNSQLSNNHQLTN